MADSRGTRVLVASSDRVGERMAGPAIRAYEIATALARHHEVTLAGPPGSAPIGGEAFGLAAASPGSSDFLDLARANEILIAQFLPGSLLARLIGGDPRPRLVMDLYDPRPLEALERGFGLAADQRRLRLAADAVESLAYLAAADFVVCASERQRDLWVGAAMGAGLIEPAIYSEDPTCRSVVDVVPFGVPEDAPNTDGAVLKGVMPGVGDRDRVVVWGGGVWDWLDPITAVKAVEIAATRIERLKLFFMGTGRPPEGEASSFPTMHAGSELERYVAEHGLEGELVVLNRDWIPYRDRGAYLLEADLGVSTHVDHLEARYAFRTRVLDYLWAGLPVVATEGDVLADLIAAKGLGRTAPPGVPEALAEGIVALLADDGEYRATAGRVAAMAPSLRWSRAVEPLLAFCERPPATRSSASIARAKSLIRRSRRLKRSLIFRERGFGGYAREATAALRRRAGRVQGHD
jgi:glycosyltransferase involved in cell wall biosynthesis